MRLDAATRSVRFGDASALPPPASGAARRQSGHFGSGPNTPPFGEGGLVAPVELLEPTGHGIILLLRVQDQPFEVLPNDRRYLALGATVPIALAADRLYLFGPDGTRVP